MEKITNMKKVEEIALKYAREYLVSRNDSHKKNILFKESSIIECEKVSLEVARWKDEQDIASLGGWSSEEPKFDCFCLVKTPEFPKNCEYVVAEWDNDAKCFYSESDDTPIETWDKWKLIEKQTI